jgi:hypothetical protein
VHVRIVAALASVMLRGTVLGGQTPAPGLRRFRWRERHAVGPAHIGEITLAADVEHGETELLERRARIQVSIAGRPSTAVSLGGINTAFGAYRAASAVQSLRVTRATNVSSLARIAAASLGPNPPAPLGACREHGGGEHGR